MDRLPRQYRQIPSYQPPLVKQEPRIRDNIPTRPIKRVEVIDRCIGEACGIIKPKTEPQRSEIRQVKLVRVPNQLEKLTMAPQPPTTQEEKKPISPQGFYGYNATPQYFGPDVLPKTEAIAKQRIANRKQQHKMIEEQFAGQGRGGMFGIGDYTPRDDLNDPFYFAQNGIVKFGPTSTQNLKLGKNTPPKKLDNAKLYEPSNVYDEYPIEGWF